MWPISTAAAGLEVYELVTRIIVAVVLAPLFFVVLFFLPPVWLAVLVFSLLFSLGSILFYGCWLVGRNGRKRDWTRLILAGLIWLGSLIDLQGKKVSDIYVTLLQDIYAPLFLFLYPSLPR